MARDDLNDRVVKFSSDGDFIMDWGWEGTAPGQFNEPHCLAFDSQGRFFVGDRTEDDGLYVADYQLREGIVIADPRDFSEIGFIENALPEGVVVDEMGNVNAGEVLTRNLKKFERYPGPESATVILASSRGRPIRLRGQGSLSYPAVRPTKFTSTVSALVT